MKTINKILILVNSNVRRFVAVYFLLLGLFNVYFLNKYEPGNLEPEKISFSGNFDRNDLLIYVKPAQASGIDFDKPIHATTEGKYFVFTLEPGLIRTFRIYFGQKTSSGQIENIRIFYKKSVRELLLSQFRSNDLKIIGEKNGRAITFSGSANAYLELKPETISNREFLKTEIVICILSFFVCFLLLFIYDHNLKGNPAIIDLKTGLAALFFSSIFLPQPVFNITFMVSFAFVLRDFDYQKFRSNKTGLLFLLYFLLFLFNNIFVSEKFNSKLLETLLPIFFFPFYFACIPRENYLKFFPISAALIGLYFFSTSLINTSIYNNIDYFSFDAFTKYVHPVYFSYLLLFSLIYLEITRYEGFNKNVFFSILIVSLLCCGSKLIIILALLFFITRLSRKRLYLSFALMSLLIVSIFTFSPTRKRFQEIFNINNLSILKDKPVKSIHDPRLNGLTLRLIIWQESINTLKGMKDFILGKGVDSFSDKILEERLVKRGLETGHTKYDPHNQFIATYYKMGIIGLFSILSICIYCFYLAIKNNKSLLLFTAILFFAAMLTESVLQRVTGIYFFLSVMLIQTILLPNYTKNLENSNTGNPRDSE